MDNMWTAAPFEAPSRACPTHTGTWLEDDYAAQAGGYVA